MTNAAATPPAPRVRSEETWAKAREAYLGGMTAEGVCERFDLGLRALRRRAREEGWRRADQADPEPVGEETDALDDDEPELNDEALAGIARRRAQRAMLRGRLQEAQGWSRLHRAYRAQMEADRRAFELEFSAAVLERRALIEDYAAQAAAREREAEGSPAAPRPPAAPEGADSGPEQAPPAHEVHAVHPVLPVASNKPPPSPADLRNQQRMAAWKARQAARGPPEPP